MKHLITIAMALTLTACAPKEALNISGQPCEAHKTYYYMDSDIKIVLGNRAGLKGKGFYYARFLDDGPQGRLFFAHCQQMREVRGY